MNSKSSRALAEPVHLVDYRPEWADDFRRERAVLENLLGPTVVAVYHYGSTAVPGMRAKPIIDMMVVVEFYGDRLADVRNRLEAAGYEYQWRRSWGRPDIDPHAFAIKRDVSGSRTHHLHIVEARSPYIRRVQIAQYLIDYPWLASLYGSLKEQLARRFRDDRVAYTRTKSRFLEAAVALIEGEAFDEVAARERLGQVYRACLEP